ncbi:ATP-dependent DNA ligase Cdc17, partial [Coemansia helicoidea]
LRDVVMACINKVAPDHEGIELGIGESILIKAIASATGRQAARIKQEHQELGDLGMVAQRCKTSQRTMFKPKPLSVTRVLQTFKEIAQTSGSSAVQKKSGLISGLLAACSTSSEAKFLIRALEGRLRIGLAESTVQVALAHAALMYETKRDDLEPEDLQKATDSLKQVLSEYPVYDSVIGKIYEYGIGDVANHCTLTPTLPVKPMLAKIEKAADDILRRFEGRPFTCEYKYDGERSQIHYVRDADGSERCVVFSRNAENNTAKYPDIAGSVSQFANASVTSFILDCEAVAWDRDTGKIRSFQTLSSRRRKVDDKSEITVGVCCFAFDLLFLNGEVGGGAAGPGATCARFSAPPQHMRQVHPTPSGGCIAGRSGCPARAGRGLQLGRGNHARRPACDALRRLAGSCAFRCACVCANWLAVYFATL